MERYIPKLFPLMEKCLTDSNQSLKLDALVFLKVCIDQHPAAAVQEPLMQGNLLALVAARVSDDWFKVISEALRVLSSVIGAMRPRDAAGGRFTAGAQYFADVHSAPCQSFVSVVFTAIMNRLDAFDIDQEIKECAISAIGKVTCFIVDPLHLSFSLLSRSW